MTRTAAPPPGARMPERHPQAPKPGTDLPPHYRHCYGCGDQHPAGLHLAVRVGEGLSVEGTFTVTDQHQGAPGLAHGGLLATAFDETLGYLLWLVGQPAVTGRLEVDYLTPVPVGSTLAIAARVVGAEGRKIFTEAVGRIGGTDAVRARGLFVMVEVQHFLQHGWAAEVTDVRDRLSRLNPYNP